MVVFGSKSSSAKTKLFEQPLDKLLSPKTVKQLNEAIRRQNSKLSTNNTQANGSSYQRINNYYANNSNNKLLLNNSNSFSNDSDIIRDPDEDERCRLLMLNVLPEPIKRLLAELYARGPGTVGIFRKSPNAKHCKELRQKLETLDGLSSIEQFQVNVIASVFKVFFDLLETVADYCRRWQEAVTVKEWLRSLPDCLLMSRLYPQWIDIAKLIEPLHLDKMRQQQQQQHQQRDLATNAGIENVDVELHSQQITTQQTTPTTTTMTAMTSGSSNDVRMQTMLSMTAFELRERHSECIRIVRQLLDALNETNLILLRAIVCVLWHIAGNAEYNKMCSNNLGVCIGQSLLNDEHQRKQHKSRRSSSLGLSNTLMQSSNHNLHTTSNQLPISSSSALRHFSTSTFAKRHRRSRSQGLLASTLSLTNLSSHLSSSPSACVTSNQRISSSSITNLKQQVNNNNNSYSTNNYLNTNDAQEAAKYVPILVAFMIDNAVDLFGSNIVNLFGPRPPPSTDVEDENVSPSELHNKSLQQQQQQQSSCLTKSMEVDVCSPASSTDKSEEGADRDSGHDDDNDHDQQQQRPLSAAESTTSSSRASSSTSGVHSQSPAFSNESTNDYRCQSGGSGSNSSDNGVGNGNRGSHRRSLSNSISSPDSSASSSTSNPNSICTSPNADDMDTVDGMVIIHHHHHEHHIDVNFAQQQQQQQQQQLLIKHRLSESQLNERDDDGILVVAVDKQMSKLVDSDESHQFVGCINRQMETATATTARIVNRLNLTSKANCSERPKSMVNLRGLEDVFAQQHTSNLINNNLNEEQQQQQQEKHSKQHANQQFASQHNDYANFVAAGGDMDGNSKATASKRINNNNYNDNQFQSQTLNRYSSRQQQQQQHQQHPVMFNRLPKIPFQYTTSCYGGEAVVYYPSNAQQRQQEQQKQQQLHHHHQQQQSYPSLHRGCNRIQSLDRQSGSNRQHLQQQQQHQQQMPQRSHVMMLRDYYLSLQEQSHRQQHQAQLISNHQRATGGTASSISHGNYLQRVQQQQQERQYLQRQHSTSQQLVVALNNTAVTRLQHHQNLQSMQSLDLSRPPTLVHRFSSASSHDLYPPTPAPTTNSAYVSAAANNGGITESSQQQQQQPASAAIAYQRIRPRLARIRQNQFNGLYVKRASSPHSITTSSATGNATGLIVRPLDDCELSSAAAAKVAAGVVSKSACAASLMAVSQSSLSQQSSKMSSSSSGSTEHSADDDESDDCSTEWMESTMV